MVERFRGKIHPGATCVQGQIVFVWPHPPTFKPVDVDKVFEVVHHNDGNIVCVAKGFGCMNPLSDYGKGSIQVLSGVQSINKIDTG
jgi:hypothetical protein